MFSSLCLCVCQAGNIVEHPLFVPICHNVLCFVFDSSIISFLGFSWIASPLYLFFCWMQFLCVNRKPILIAFSFFSCLFYSHVCFSFVWLLPLPIRNDAVKWDLVSCDIRFSIMLATNAIGNIGYFAVFQWIPGGTVRQFKWVEDTNGSSNDVNMWIILKYEKLFFVSFFFLFLFRNRFVCIWCESRERNTILLSKRNVG